MNRYFCLCLGGVASSHDASVDVESFDEIKKMLGYLKDDIPHKFVRYETQLIMNESPIKFPHWGAVYMVKGFTEEGEMFPLGYCNFNKSWSNRLSTYSILLCILILLAVFAAVHNALVGNFVASMWSTVSAMLVVCILMLKQIITRKKFLYLLK